MFTSVLWLHNVSTVQMTQFRCTNHDKHIITSRWLLGTRWVGSSVGKKEQMHHHGYHLNWTLAGLSRVSGRVKLSQSCGVAAGAALARLKATTTTTTLLHTLNMAEPQIRLLHKGLLENVPKCRPTTAEMEWNKINDKQGKRSIDWMKLTIEFV